MANIIDISYFVGDIEIPNISQEEIEADVNNSITIYEKEVLIALLGYPMYKELRAATPAPGDKWYKLINGEEFTFTVDGQEVNTKWDGLKGEEKKSLIAYYVYFMHRRKRQSYNAGVGIEVEADTDNSKPSSLYVRLVDVWNGFVKMYGFDCYVEDDDFGYNLDYYQHYNDEPSAYNYLLAKKADFTNWKFKSQGGEIDRFGLTD